MQFADYNAFRVSLQWLIEGDELSDTFSVNTLDLIIGLGEGRVVLGDADSPGLRASSMVKPLSVSISGNSAALPADMLELKEVWIDGAPLEVVPLDTLRRAVDAGGGGTARYCAQDGDSLVFYPEASGTLTGRYWARPAGLQTALHTTFVRYPELYTYACLFEAALFLGMTDKMPIWEGRYRQLASGASHAEGWRVYGASPLRIRAR